MSTTSLYTALRRALERRNPTLFLGAGVGVRVGYPAWPDYLDSLATAAETWNDPASATLIRQRVLREKYPEAATVYKTCDVIPRGERWKLLAQPFTRALTESQTNLLVPLITLPVSAIITTNYDHSLHRAAVKKGRWFLPVEINDDTLRGAAFQREFFIARIHGRADVPQSMVVATEDYSDLRRNREYEDFLLEILRSRSCLFAGFSFLDPAIQEVLRLYKDRAGPVFPSLHSAIIPAPAMSLAQELRTLNIEVVTYEPDDRHSALWRAIRMASESRAGQKGKERVVAAPTTGLQRFMAFAYAQIGLRNGDNLGAAEVVQDGILISLLEDQQDNGADLASVADALRGVLRLSTDDALTVASRSIARLVARGQVVRVDDRLGLQEVPRSPLDDDLDVLTAAIADRVRVRHGIRLSGGVVTRSRAVLESCLLARAWDLAAHYAGAPTGFGSDVRSVIRDLTTREFSGGKVRAAVRGAIADAIADLLHHPEDKQAKLLARLGRAAFGLQLVLSTPRQVLFQQFALPQRLYLDANVVMPAITHGHPLHGIYSEAIQRLAHAARSAGGRVEIVVEEQFLNEIVAHRSLAIEAVERLNLEDDDDLRRHIALRGPLYSNVFVAAFASQVKASAGESSFADFLARVAPYDSTDKLAAHLNSVGIGTEPAEGAVDEIFGNLLGAYEETARDAFVRGKEKILIKDEAQQLAQLAQDEERGVRSVFVTADERLRRLLHRFPKLRRFAGLTMTRLGLVALVDVMVGLDADPRSLVRLVWATPHNEEQASLLEYFTHLGLRNYEEGTAVEMQEAARRVAEELAREATEKKIGLLDAQSLEEVAEVNGLLSRYEDNFFRYWREAIEHRERQGG